MCRDTLNKLQLHNNEILKHSATCHVSPTSSLKEPCILSTYTYIWALCMIPKMNSNYFPEEHKSKRLVMVTESVRVCRHVGSGCWSVINVEWDLKDLAKAQAVNRRPVAANARVPVPAHSLWDFWRKHWVGSGFTASTSALLCHCHSIGTPYSFSYYSCRKDKPGSLEIFQKTMHFREI